MNHTIYVIVSILHSVENESKFKMPVCCFLQGLFGVRVYCVLVCVALS